MSKGDIQIIAEDAIGISVSSAEQAQAIAAELRKRDEFIEVVAGLESTTVKFNPSMIGMATVQDVLRSAVRQSRGTVAKTSEAIEIAVRYGGVDGPDLSEICTRLDILEADFIAQHTSKIHTVDMIGFTPGFAYLSGMDQTFSVPRLGTPRSRVPAGSVGISGAYTGLYALPGPGGWPLIGRTDVELFDPRTDAPFLLHPGQRIKFKAL